MTELHVFSYVSVLVSFVCDGTNGDVDPDRLAFTLEN